MKKLKIKKNSKANDTITRTIRISGDIFDKTGKSSITNLGIQASTGTTFFLHRSKNPIQVGKTWIYEKDF